MATRPLLIITWKKCVLVSAAEKAMIDEAARRQNEELVKKQLGVTALGARCELPRVTRNAVLPADGEY